MKRINGHASVADLKTYARELEDRLAVLRDALAISRQRVDQAHRRLALLEASEREAWSISLDTPRSRRTGSPP